MSCCVEPRGISRVTPRPAEIHPASFTYHDLRFEALRVGGTMIIVRDNREVLEEIYLDKHFYLLIDGGYRKLPMTADVRNQLIHSIEHTHGKSTDWLVKDLLQKHAETSQTI